MVIIWKFNLLSFSTFVSYCAYRAYQFRGRIPGRNSDKSLKTFPPCYSQSPLVYSFAFEISIYSNSRNLKSENSQDYAQKPQVWELKRLCPEPLTKSYVHEFGFSRIPIAQLIFYFYFERIDKQGITTSGISFSQLYTIDLSTYLYLIAGESVSNTDGELQRCRRSGTASTQQSLERTAGHCSRHSGNQLKGQSHKCMCSPPFILFRPLALASNACDHWQNIYKDTKMSSLQVFNRVYRLEICIIDPSCELAPL
jgi:hypothetical protein